MCLNCTDRCARQRSLLCAVAKPVCVSQDLTLAVAAPAAPHAAVAAEAAQGLPPAKRASVWLYNMLPTAQSADQLGQAEAAQTVLARVVSGPGDPPNSSYALHFVLPSGSLLTGKQALVKDMLGSSARILASYSVCSTMVHVVDALLWPAASTAVADVPDPAIGGVFRDPLAAVLPNASQIWCAAWRLAFRHPCTARFAPNSVLQECTAPLDIWNVYGGGVGFCEKAGLCLKMLLC